jgi:hypothetical protein
MGAAQADWSISMVSRGEDQTIRHAIDISVGAKSRLTVVKAIIRNDRANFEIDPACQGYLVLRQIDCFLRRVEVIRLLYIQFDHSPVKRRRAP